MAVNFLQAAGTNGFIATPFNLQSTELNALASGGAATSSVGGSSGVFSQTNDANAIWGSVYFTAGGASTPTAGGYIAGWFLRSTDGGTTFESAIATPSTTVPALQRSPDFIIPFSAAALSTGNIVWATGLVRLPFESYKVVIQNMTGAALSASGHTVKLGPVATQY